MHSDLSLFRRSVLLSIIFLLLLGTFTADGGPNIDFYRRQLQDALGVKGSTQAVLIFSNVAAIDSAALDSAQDYALLDELPEPSTDGECVIVKETRLSGQYRSLFTRSILALPRYSAEEVASYKRALETLYYPPDPALLLRGKKPVPEPTDKLLAYLSKSKSILRQWQGLEPSEDPFQVFIDIFIERGVHGEITNALQIVRNHQINDLKDEWSQKAKNMAAGTTASFTTPRQEEWLENTGWTKRYLFAEAEGLGVQLELKVVRIDRDWFDTSIFLLRQWTKLDGDRMLRVSTGNLPSGDSTDSDLLIPWYPASLILARNVQKLGTWKATDENKAPGFVNLVDPAPVVLGEIVSVLPKSPNPDLALIWPESVMPLLQKEAKK